MALLRPHPTDSLHPPTGPSFLAAVAVTAAMLAMAAVAGVRVPATWWDRGAPPAAERITYIAPPVPVVPVVPPRPAPPIAGRGAVPTAPAAPSVTAPLAVPRGITPSAPRIGPAPFPGLSAPDTGAAAGRPSRTGGARGGAGGAPQVGPTLGPLQSGATLPAPPPYTRAQQDSVLKAWTREVFGNPAIRAQAVQMAKDAQARADAEYRRQSANTLHGGSPVYEGLKLGIGIKFGGRSVAQQRADSIVDADVIARLKRAAARADSARRDSVRRATNGAPIP